MNKNFSFKVAVVLLIIVVIALFRIFDLGQFLSLSYIKESQSYFQELYAENGFFVVTVYMLIYIIVAALSLPGAAVLTLTAGALFGLWVGVLVVSFASTIGATLACLVARFLLRDWVQNKFSNKLQKINQGIKREGAFYLFTLRLIPAFPFFVINLAMGLTKIKLWTFYWVSQVGMLAGTFVYVNAGRELGRIDSLGGILSPRLIISFVMLGIFPLAAKKIMSFIRRKRDLKGEVQ